MVIIGDSDLKKMDFQKYYISETWQPRKKSMQWTDSKKVHLQGAQILRNEAYF
jgi:hypothetical protein